MFLPLRDENPTRRIPWVTYALIVANIVIYLRQHFGGADLTILMARVGLVPARFAEDPLASFPAVLTSMFTHGGLLHLAGNMLTLHVFGDNIEDSLGRFRFGLFYVLSGLGAAVAQVVVDPTSTVPMVGASGAIAGVVGAYVILYPWAPVLSLNTFPLLWIFLGVVTVVPAWVIGGLFFTTNLVMAYFTPLSGGAGVAFFAHLGGFIVGLSGVKWFIVTPPRSGPRWGGFPGARRGRRR